MNQVKIEIGPSRILAGQIGVLAVRTLPKDTVIAHASLLEESFCRWSEFEKNDEPTRRHILKFCLQTVDGYFVPQDFDYLTVPWHMNHSCDYNIGFDKNGNFVTSRSVSAGEELVWDYGMGFSFEEFRLECRCGSPNCRVIVTGNDWKNSEYLQKNRHYFLRELLVSSGLNCA